MKPGIIFLAFACSLFLACKKETTEPAEGPPAKTILNASYGTDAAQKIDIYLPANRSVNFTKVMVIIHGGGWTGGDKAEFTPYIDSLQKRLPGYAIFNINYRLATGSNHFFPTQEQDVKTALDSIYARKNEYGISDKFILLGASAGGHLALLQAYKYNTPYKIKAVVDFFGPTELVTLYNTPPNPLVQLLLWQVTGGSPATKPAIYQGSSPVFFVNTTSPPTIVLQGGADIVVPPSQSEILKDKLAAMTVAHQYVFYPAEGHGWGGTVMSDSFDKIQAFLNAHVQ